ncbi:hypothetical protein J2X50_003173 [Aminobacter sp. BE322]
MLAMAAMHEHVQQRAGEDDQERQPCEEVRPVGHDIDTRSGEQAGECDFGSERKLPRLLALMLVR